MMGVRSSVGVFVGASAVVHAAFVLAMAVPDNSPSAASPPPALTTQGNSFADMVQGAETTDPNTIEPTEVTNASEASEVSNAANLQPLNPSEDAVLSEVAPGIQVQSDMLSETTAEVLATAAAPTIPEIEAAAPAQIASVQPQIIEALPDVEVNEVTSDVVRPPRRPANLGQTPPPPPPQPRQTQPVRQTQRAQPAPAGNANQDAQQGTVTATQNAGHATQSGQGQQADQAAIAAARPAAANYGNVVMRQISRTRRERTRSRGVAVVSFRVGASGQLASVGIAQSSGDVSLDQVAVNHVRRTAPFPAPPRGAQTSFSIQFQGQ